MSTTWSLVKNDLCNFLKHLSFEKKSLSFCPLSFPKMYLKRACTTECIALLANTIHVILRKKKK